MYLWLRQLSTFKAGIGKQYKVHLYCHDTSILKKQMSITWKCHNTTRQQEYNDDQATSSLPHGYNTHHFTCLHVCQDKIHITLLQSDSLSSYCSFMSISQMSCRTGCHVIREASHICLPLMILNNSYKGEYLSLSLSLSLSPSLSVCLSLFTDNLCKQLGSSL